MSDTPLQRVLAAFPNARRVGAEYLDRCPCHDDKKASLNFREVENGNVILKCRAGCETATVLATVGLKLSDLFPPKENRDKPTPAHRVKGRVVAEYPYHDQSGELRYRVERDHNKEFWPSRPDGRGGWINNLQGVDRLPYRLPELIAAVGQGEVVLINEGEKDVDNCRALGFASTTTAGGVGSKNVWRSLARDFQGAKVCILPDNDEPGREYAAAVAAALAPVAVSVQILELSGLPPKGDVSDWIQAGGTADDLRALVAAAALWTPTFWPEPGASAKQEISATLGATGMPVAYKLTDLGNAERFVAAHGANYRFDHDLKQWYCFDGKRWAIDGTGAVLESAKQTIRAMYAEASAEPDDERRTALIKHATASERVGRITAMVELAKTVPCIAVQQRAWDADPMTFNCQNGTLDLRTGELHPHCPGDLITKIAPVVYDPTATAPTWEKCLARWQPDDEVRQFLARAAGYSLTGNIGEETAFFTYGLGRNGKSKFTGALAYVMGEYATRVSIEALMESRRAGAATPDLIPLVGARLVVASEVHEGKRLNESYIKDLTGGDAITARANYGAVFVFHPSFKLWMYGNHKPDIRGTDDGIWSRLPLIPFTVTIPVEERDPELSAKLEAEATGILAWAVRGCLEWQKMRLAPPEAVLLATAEYRKQQDPTTNFFADRCVVDANDDALFTSSATLYKSYEEWAEGEGERRLLSTKAFGERLTRLGLKSDPRRIAGKATRCWVGIGLLPSIPRCPGASCNGCNGCNGSFNNSDDTHMRGEITEIALHPLHPLQNLAFTEEDVIEEEEEERI